MRLIDADALITDLERQYAEVFGKARKTVNPDDFYIERSMAYRANVTEAEQNGFFEYLNTRPTIDAVEVVRCKDCKYYHASEGWCDKHSHFIEYDGSACHPWESDSWKMFMEDYYCADGKRKSST